MNAMHAISNTIFPAWYIDGVLTPEQCEELIKNDIDIRGTDTVQAVEELPELYDLIYNAFQQRAPGIVSPVKKKLVTTTKSSVPVLPHKDGTQGCVNATHKLAIYLNDLSDAENPEDSTGGTRFHSNFDSPEISAAIPRVGRAILFDLREWHSGGIIPDGKHKYMMGIRVCLRNSL